MLLFSPVIDAGLAGLLGLLVGSFLNVVIYRLPKMMEREWAAECAELAGKPPAEDTEFNLVRPRSRCRQCGHVIRWYENVPVLSYLALRGKCSACGTADRPALSHGRTCDGCPLLLLRATLGRYARGAAWCLFSAAIVTLAMIDWDTTLLPDDITLPLLWDGPDRCRDALDLTFP
jgi:leader peptidase (prepilin peptidase)/N-methyltransferase